MSAHDLATELRLLGELRIRDETNEAEAAAAMRALQDFNRCMVGLVRLSAETPWEKHPHDELLVLLEGEIELTALPARDPRWRRRMRRCR